MINANMSVTGKCSIEIQGKLSDLIFESVQLIQQITLSLAKDDPEIAAIYLTSVHHFIDDQDFLVVNQVNDLLNELKAIKERECE